MSKSRPGSNQPSTTPVDPEQPENEGVEDSEESETVTNRDEVNAAVASSLGGSDQYPYIDVTKTPLHETDQPMDSSTEASQAELNPAFTPKAEDGGPVNANGDGIGTAPNAEDLQIAAAQNAEEIGEANKGAVADAEAAIEAGKDQQMDAEKVTADAEANAEGEQA